MLIITYDFGSDKTRTKFAKFLKKYGDRMQYSVFEIQNSQRVLNNILSEVKHKYEKKFTGADSIVIFPVCETCKKKMLKFGYAKNEENAIVFL